MDWIILAFALQLGYSPNATVVMYDPPPGAYLASGQVIVSMQSEIRIFDCAYVGGDFAVPAWIAGWRRYFPSELQSVFRAGVRFCGLEIGYSHLCTHPVIPYQPIYNSQVLWEGFYDEFHIKFSGEVRF